MIDLWVVDKRSNRPLLRPTIDKYKAERVGAASATVISHNVKKVIRTTADVSFCFAEKDAQALAKVMLGERITAAHHAVENFKDMIETGIPVLEIGHLPYKRHENTRL